MRSLRVTRFRRGPATPTVRQGDAPLGVRRQARRLWPILTVLRRVERLVEAEETQEREDNPFAATWGGDEPNA